MKEAATLKGSAARYLSRPSFVQLVAAQRRHVAWVYKLAGGDETRLVAPEGLTLDEALETLRMRFGRPVEYLRPAGGGHE